MRVSVSIGLTIARPGERPEDVLHRADIALYRAKDGGRSRTEADVSVQHFGLARSLDMETVGFLMLSHKATPAVLAQQARIMVDAGAQCVYVVDSAGALVLSDAQERVQLARTVEAPGEERGFVATGSGANLNTKGSPIYEPPEQKPAP